MSGHRFVQQSLSNGLMVVIEVMPEVRSTACGFLVRAGTRDEPRELIGVSHFLEHMCFKGTARRTFHQLNIEFDDIGADNNAQTDKDETFFYSWARTEDLPRQLDLLADMMRPVFPADQFEVERNVVLEEIATYKDDLVSNAYDFACEHIWAGSALACPVLGYRETVMGISRNQMRDYFARRYTPDNMILVVAGNVDPQEVLTLVEQLCGIWQRGDRPHTPRETPHLHTGTASLQMERFHQQAVVLVFPSAPAPHRLDESGEALAAILGGANSRFFWNIVQKGLATQAGVEREEYEDCGLMFLYGLCEPANSERLLDAMRQEADAITREGPMPHEVQRVRNLRRTQLASEAEAPGYRLGQLVDDVDYRGRPRTAEERLAGVDAVCPESIAEYLQAFPITGEGFTVTVGPRDWLKTG